MQQYPSVLLVAPTNKIKNYCLPAYLDQLKTIDYPTFDVLMCDNSPTRKNQKHIESKGVKCLWNNPEGRNNIVYITESQELLRKYAIDNNYDYMFWLESDVFVPFKSIIHLLMLHNKPVVAAMYHILTGDKTHLMLQQVSDDPKYAVTYNLESPDDFIFADGSLKKVFAAGLGCTLVKREVFTKIGFRYELGVASHSDTFFYHDLFKNKIPAYIDSSICVKHRNQDWQTLKHV